MSGPKPSYPIELTEEEKEQLEKQVRAHKTGQDQVVRAKLLLVAHEHPEWSNTQIAKAVGTTDRTVRKWRGRWVATHTIADAPRPGAPRRFGSEVRAAATALACSLPSQSQVPLSRWSRTSIARAISGRLKQTGRPAPSARTVGRWLKAERIRPWRYHSWQHLHDLESFLLRARPVLQAYRRAKALLTEGIWLVCMDEKTSIQAREGEQAPRPAEGGSPQLQESRYQRRGALNLFAALSVADGKVCGVFRDRKRFVDFQRAILEMIIPEALDRGVHTVELILDNGTTHAPKQLERWLRHLPEVEQGQLTFHVMWLPTNASWLDQIEIWFSLMQRQLLQPNHFVTLDELRHAINAFLAYYNEEAKAIKWTYTVEKLEKKLEKRKLLQAEQKHLQLEVQKGEQSPQQLFPTKAA
jgi:DDE superfamily endonuclease/homeodomain-containing protein